MRWARHFCRANVDAARQECRAYQMTMLDRPIIALARQVRALAPSDSAARAAGLLRSSGVNALPVVDAGRVIGVVSESSILHTVSEALKNGAGSASDVSITDAIHQQAAFAHRDMSVGQVAEILASGKDESLPIVDDFGGFHGMITRSDVLAFLAGSMRPANVAGMATPLGVYLTNGNIRAGAGDIGLFLSGVTLGLAMLTSVMVVWLLCAAAQALTGLPFRDLIEPMSRPTPPWLLSMQWAPPVLMVFIIMTIIRLSPLSGYHAAEHMTVHAIEAGEDLTPESVRNMPRVHARCGTNLLAAVGLFGLITIAWSTDMAVWVAMAVVILGWRAVGGYIQRVATTKAPSDRHLKNGLAAGKELLARFNERPNYQVTGLARIWNSGMLQSLAGLAFTLTLVGYLAKAIKFAPLMLGV